ncbi:MAG: hypothetical protein L0387_05030 [Acidobacteria bacterium]|nr:hypothetical protein [Acidobacteriota bacterium]MCI0621026.1 hypothetical protein [Acidobacteriota bacterium]
MKIGILPGIGLIVCLAYAAAVETQRAMTVVSTTVLALQAPVTQVRPGQRLMGFSLSKASVIGGPYGTLTGRVRLDFVAPNGGTTVYLTAEPPLNAVITLPPSVHVNESQAQGTFEISTAAVQATRQGTITARAGGVSRSATLTVEALRIQALGIIPPGGFGPFQATGTVTLNLPAPGNTTVTLTSSNPNVVRFGAIGSAQNTGNVVIQQNQSLGTFPVLASPVTQPTTVTVTATLNGSTRSSSITVR